MASSIKTEVIPTFVKDDLEIIHNIIGSGGMGVVSLYRWKISRTNQGIMSGQEVAVKKLDSASDIRSIKEEAKILWRIRGKCEYILHFYGLISSSSSICLILDYMEHGNMSSFFQKITRHRNIDASRLWPLKRQIALQLCTGMDFLHQWKPKPILHCDLKAENVLLDDKLNVKICDFGLSRVKATTKPRSFDTSKGCYQPPGTLSHLAPELFGGKARQSTKSDVYSFGILLWELTSDQIPYEGVILETIAYQVVRENYRPSIAVLPTCSPRIFVDVMQEAWDKDPGMRPDFSELCRRFKFEDSRCAQENGENALAESVSFALQTWNQGFGSETVPKQHNNVQRRSADLALLPNVRSPSLATERSRITQQMDRQSVSDISENDICVSASTRSSVLIDVRDSEADQSIKEELNPLMAQPPIRVVQNPAVGDRNCKNKCFIKVLASVVCILFSCGIGFACGSFLWPMVNRGCCIRCFDGTDTGLQRECNPDVGGKSIASPGSACKFSCDDGSVLSVNVSVLTCGHDGIWSGPMPFCRKIRQCPALTNPANGGSYKCTDGYFENSQCSFTCPDDFRLRLPGGDNGPTADSFDITCNEDNLLNFNWSGKEPYCEKIASCQSLTKDPNVKLNCVSPGTTTRYEDTANNETYINGTVCKFSCSPPVSLPTSDDTALCQDDGTWNTSSTVECIESCSAFEDPLHGNHSCTLDRKYNSRCTFTCDKDFVMVGTGNMVCPFSGPSKGKWTNKPPKCECPGCKSGDQCQNTLLFQDTWAQLNSTLKMATVFDGREIVCSVKRPADTDNFNYGCQCRDKKTNMNKQCNDELTQSESCYKAYSSLVLMLAYNGTVGLPCDAATMPVPGICK